MNEASTSFITRLCSNHLLCQPCQGSLSILDLHHSAYFRPISKFMHFYSSFSLYSFLFVSPSLSFTPCNFPCSIDEIFWDMHLQSLHVFGYGVPLRLCDVVHFGLSCHVMDNPINYVLLYTVDRLLGYQTCVVLHVSPVGIIVIPYAFLPFISRRIKASDCLLHMVHQYSVRNSV